MIRRFLYLLWKNTLSSVPFGIATMAMIAIYIAVGSGRASVREYFEMNELQFFSTWWLIALMVLLVVNLITVTLTRIPFTPPRYGVWCVHAGIITLIYGMFIYYSQKVEGLARIPIGGTAEHFYDSYERGLYTRVGRRQALPAALPSLPRFDSYPVANAEKSAYLDRKDLRGIKPTFMVASDAGEPQSRTLGQEIGLGAEPVIDVVGYHPYAEIATRFNQDPSGKGQRGIKVTARDGDHEDVEWLVESADGAGRRFIGDVLVEHRDLADAGDIEKYITAAQQFHRLDILVGDEGVTLFVEPGKTYNVGKTGYVITVENYLPNWRTMQGEIVDLLTFMVKSPTMEFRRQVIPGRSTPTDWKLDEPGAGPMGKRQDKPLDDKFRTAYSFNDPMRLLATDLRERHLLLTTPGAGEVVHLTIGQGSRVERLTGGKGSIEVVQVPPRGPFQPKLTAEELASFPKITLGFERAENLQRIDQVIDTPKAHRDRDEGAAGVRQVLSVRITAGDWSEIYHIPFAQYAAEADSFWRGRDILIPGAQRPFRLQLSNSLHEMPARVTLAAFDLIPYQGGQKSAGSLMRDFKSTLEVESRETGAKMTDVAHMNHPVYIERARPWFMPDESWLLFQAQWDPQGQRFSVIGVGNRPGVVTMTVGSIMIGAGLLYAFYVKPIIIQRNKRRAIEEAKTKPAKQRVKTGELVAS